MTEAAPSQPGTETSVHRTDRDRFAAFALAAADLLIEVNAQERVAYVTGASQAFTGRERRQLIGGAFQELFVEAHRGVARTLLRQLRHKRRMEPLRIGLARANQTVDVVLRGCWLPERPNTLYFTATRAVDAPAANAATCDAETGLLNRSDFQAAAGTALRDSAPRDLTLTLLDIAGIDDLRSQSGDEAVSGLLGEIGDFLASHAIDRASAGRLAPNRFAVLQEGGKAADLQAGIAHLSGHDGSARKISAKEQTLPLQAGGLTPADAEKALAYTLGRFADVGPGPIRSLADGFRELVSETVDRISHMRSSISHDRLSIALQPVVTLPDRALHHYEVLSRFEGERSPAELVRFAESVGMIEELDLSVCQRALALMESRSDNPGFALAVNLSGRSLLSDAFVGALEALLKSCTDRKRLLFEITETTAITDLPRVDRILQGLRQSGHKVCLDDFGAGAASFPYLQALTIDFVKIDGAYVSRMPDTRRDHAILKAIVALCNELGTATIAEMIETDAQAQRMATVGVGYGQGFLFGRPAPAEATIDSTSRKVPPKSTVFARRKGYVETWG